MLLFCARDSTVFEGMFGQTLFSPLWVERVDGNMSSLYVLCLYVLCLYVRYECILILFSFARYAEKVFLWSVSVNCVEMTTRTCSISLATVWGQHDVMPQPAVHSALCLVTVSH